MRPLLVAIALLLALPASASPSVRLGSVRARGAVRVSIPPPVPFGALYLFDGEDVDGQRNASLADGASVTRWINHGTLGDIGDAVQTQGASLAPTLDKDGLNSNRDVLTFDGGDWLTAGASTDQLDESDTGVFTYWAVVRRDASASGSVRSFASSAAGGTLSGVAMFFEAANKAWTFGPNGAGNTWLKTDGQAVANDTYHLVQIRGDGTTLYLRTDANAEVTVAMGAKSTPGSCRGVMRIGAANSPGIAYYWIGGIAWLGMWDRELLPSERTRLHAYLTARYGVP